MEGAAAYYGDGPADYPSGVGAGMRVLHCRAARWYAERYAAEHGRLPEGRHRVEVWAYPKADQPSAGIENVYGSRRRVEVDIIYPTSDPD